MRFKRPKRLKVNSSSATPNNFLKHDPRLVHSLLKTMSSMRHHPKWLICCLNNIHQYSVHHLKVASTIPYKRTTDICRRYRRTQKQFSFWSSWSRSYPSQTMQVCTNKASLPFMEKVPRPWYYT